MNISQKAIDLIIKFETGGEDYFNKYLTSVSWPSGESGCTVMCGIDLGYYSEDEYIIMFKSIMNPDDFELLKTSLGYKGQAARDIVEKYKNIHFTWEQSMNIFNNYTLPKFYNLTIRTFPGADKLNANCTGALVSLVFNRGSSITGDSRKEMKDIKGFVSKRLYKNISDSILSMKRLWMGKGLEGLLARRDAEAALVLSCISS